MTKATQLMPWFGSDVNSAGAIVEAIGDHTHYVEPFCGGLSVLFAKPRVVNERVNDLNGELVNLARVVADDENWEMLNDRLARTVWSEDLYREAADNLAEYRCEHRDGLDGPGLRSVRSDWAYAAFVVAWMGRGGFAGTEKIQGVSRRNDAGGGWSGSRFRSACDRLAWMHERLRTVEITNIDGITLAGAMRDDAGLVIFCDPPFIDEGGAYAHSFETRETPEGGVFDIDTPDDHDRLAAALQKYESARVVVEYHDHERLEGLYPRERWRRIQLETGDQIGNGKKGRKRSVLLVNDGGLG